MTVGEGTKTTGHGMLLLLLLPLPLPLLAPIRRCTSAPRTRART